MCFIKAKFFGAWPFVLFNFFGEKIGAKVRAMPFRASVRGRGATSGRCLAKQGRGAASVRGILLPERQRRAPFRDRGHRFTPQSEVSILFHCATGGRLPNLEFERFRQCSYL